MAFCSEEPREGYDKLDPEGAKRCTVRIFEVD